MICMKNRRCFAGLLLISSLIACSDNEVKIPEPEYPYTSYYYYSYETDDKITAYDLSLGEAAFTPGPMAFRGDTLLIANIQEGNFSLELFNKKTRHHLSSLRKWFYKGEEQTFNNRIEAVSISGDRLYLANIGSCIDVFDINTLQFITRIGTRQWGEGKFQLLHSHAMVITDGKIIIRTKNGLQVYQEVDVTSGNYQKVPYFCKGIKTGMDVNNGFNSHQMVQDTTGLVLLADYGEAGNTKIQMIDTAGIKSGDQVDLLDSERTIVLDFHPTGIALYNDRIFLTASDGTIRVYDRTKERWDPAIKSLKEYTPGKPEKLLIDGDQLWISDKKTRQVVGIHIYVNEIREYDE